MSDGSHSDIDMDLSFPMPSNKPTADDDVDILQRAADNASRPPKPPVPRSENGDVVDTFWDIPPIEFPTSNSSDEPVDGPRHAASKGMPSTAETQVIASGNTPDIVDSSSDEGDDAKTTVLKTDASSAAPTAPSEHAPETTAFSGTRLFPESGPAAQKTAIIETVPSLDFGSVISGETPAAIPPVAAAGDESVDENAHGSENSETPARKRSFKPVAIVVVVLIVTVAVGGMLLWRNRESDEDRTAALSACTGASEEYNDAKEALDQALAGAKDEQAITADQVADAATVDALKTAVDDANGIDEAAACGTSLSARDLQRNSRTNQDLTKQLNDSADAVTAAAKAVSDSRDEKTAADKTSTREALQNAVNDAQTLLNNSLWAVADNSTRVTLEEAINAANDLLQQDDPDLTAMQDAQTALQNASDGVNASMEALSAQTAQQQNMTTDNGYGYYSYNPPYGGNTTGDTMTGDAAMGDVANGGTGGGLDTGTGDADDGSETPDSVPSEPTEEGGSTSQHGSA